MRIGLVIYDNLEPRSGGYLYDSRLVETLYAHGDEVEILSQPWKPYPLRLIQNEDGGFLDRMLSGNFDVIVQDELNHPSLFALNYRFKKRSRIPIVSIVHHLRISEQPSPFQLPLIKTIEKRYLQSIDRFIFNSQTTQNEVTRLLEGEVSGLVAYPGKDLFSDGLDIVEIQNRCQRLHPVRFVFAGNLIPRKGVDLALQALAKVKDLAWTFDIIGDLNTNVKYSNQLKNMVLELGLAERVFFHGRLEPGRLFEQFRKSQILLSPAQYEGFGITFVEAMGCGLPVIALKTGAAPEVIADGETGLLVPPGDIEALAVAIRQLLTGEEVLEKMSVAARNRFDQFPSWGVSMDSIRLYLLALGNQ
ncbi:MAG: glycosyltransferase family 4 protein [Leptolinea sp.]